MNQLTKENIYQTAIELSLKKVLTSADCQLVNKIFELACDLNNKMTLEIVTKRLWKIPIKN